MKIIKQENKILKCEKCGTEFMLEPNDYYWKLHRGIIGYCDTFLPGIRKCVYGEYVYCPCCYNQIIISYD